MANEAGWVTRYRRKNPNRQRRYGTVAQAIQRAEHGPRCKRCGHTLWFHMGALEPGCVHLGSCRCKRFVSG